MKRKVVIPFLISTVFWLPMTGRASAEFYGTIESRPSGKVGTWVIGGRQVEVTEATRLDEEDGPLDVGACAEVEYEGGRVEEIESEKPSKCGK